jgi:NADH-quinone oxidoreductase subunit N
MIAMNLALYDFLLTAPLTIITLTALVVLMVDALTKNKELITWWLSIGGLILAFAAAVSGVGQSGHAFGGMVTTGGFADYFAMVFVAAGLACVLLSRSYVRKEDFEAGAYYTLLLLGVAGMILMASAENVIIFFLGLETMSVSFYVLAGFARKRATSNEAGLKYFLLGAFATGFLLYGMALLYGSVRSTDIPTIVHAAPTLMHTPWFMAGLAMILIGLAFKVAAVPFHMWVPDVYEGSPTTVSAFMSTGGKSAAFAVILLIFAPGVMRAAASLRDVLSVIAALSMIVGNIFAISQISIKRMLAYSSIAHAGYILVGIVAANQTGTTGVLFYLMAYTMMNVGAFGVLSILESQDGQNLTFDDYAGLSAKRPFLAGLMAVFMFSLAGVPPFAGFFGKYYVFVGAVEGGYTWLAILGVVMSVISVYFYLRLVVVMYFKDQVSVIDEPVPAAGFLALVLSALVLLGLGIYPSILLNITQHFF